VLGTANTGPTPAAGTSGREPTGSVDDRAQIARILGTTPDALSTLLLGPLVRGNDVQVTPVPAGAPTEEGPR
jgi:hypothetical protein